MLNFRSIMKKRHSVILGLFFLLVGVSFAQDKTDSRSVENYLDTNGSLGQYEFAYDQLLVLLNKQYPKSEANANGWAYLQDNKEKAITNMKSLLVPIYQANFSQVDISRMTDFYQSEAGRQLVKDRTKMTEAQKQELNAYYNTEVGQKVIEKQSLLTDAISAASENWSRDLYETAVSLLKSD